MALHMNGPVTTMPPAGPKEVKIAYDSFIENRGVLSWNVIISSKITKAESGDFLCLNCEFSHGAQHFVIDHIEMHHLPNFPGYKCTICKLVFQTWFIFKNHVNNIHCSNISIQTLKRSIKAPVPVKKARSVQLQPRVQPKVEPKVEPKPITLIKHNVKTSEVR